MRFPLIRLTLTAALVTPLFAFAGCNSDPRLTVDSDGGSDSDSDSDGGTDSDSDSGTDSDGDLGSDLGAGGTGPIGNGNPEICDGKDNNADGAIDNIDVGNDGICDCIKIATIGVSGTWGVGDVFNDWLEGKSTAGVVDIGEDELTAEVLAPFDVIVAQDLSNRGAFSADEIAALNDWIDQGGGLMTLIGYDGPDEVININSLLEPTGLSYDNGPILGKDGDYTHPVDFYWSPTHPVADGITAIGTDNGYEVLGDGTVFARDGSDTGFVVGQAKDVEDGRVVVWGDEWISYNSEWEQDAEAPVKYEVERFWLNVIKWIGPRESCQVPIPVTVR